MLFAKNSIIREIQAEILSDEVTVTSTLRKSRLAARKLDLNEFEKWIASESDGYANISADSLPDYRKIPAAPRFYNPYRGWCPIIVQDSSLYELCHTSYLFQPMAELENLYSSNGTLTYAYPPELDQIIRENLSTRIQFEIRAHISKNSLSKPINAVKNILLDWAVDLEKAGVLGEGLGFSQSDKKEAATVTQNIYAQNIGNLGNVSDNSTVTNNLTNNTFSADQIKTYVKQISDSIPALPVELRKPVAVELANIEALEDTETAKARFKSIMTICENAVGNLAAEGIVALIKSFL